MVDSKDTSYYDAYEQPLMGNNNVESGQSMPAEQQIANPGYDINKSVDN